MSKDTSYMNMHFETNRHQRYSEVDIISTQGRIGQKRYFLASVIIPFITFWSFASLAGLISHLGSVASIISYAVLGVAAIAMLFMLVRLTIQRCHDFNANGWLSLLAIIPLANIIFALIPGTNGLNGYGEPPEPDTSIINLAFYGLIFLLLAIVIAVAMQLMNGNFSGWSSL